MTLSARIRAARLAAGLTQEQAAGRAGMYRTNWVRLERMECDPKLSTLGRIAHVLGVTVGELVDCEEES